MSDNQCVCDELGMLKCGCRSCVAYRQERRDRIAARIMGGIAANPEDRVADTGIGGRGDYKENCDRTRVVDARRAVLQADALIAELDKEEGDDK